jgi:polyisoprenoid-binding protein YceI
MKKRLTSLLVLAGGLALPALAADTFKVDKSHGEVAFEVRHLGLSKVRGWFKDYDGTIHVDEAKPENSSVEFTVEVASIDTNVAARDKDLREGDGFLDVVKFPTMTFKSTKVVPKGKNQFDVTGDFTLHGVTKSITLPVTSIGPIADPWGNTKYGFETQITLNRKDYGITWHKVMDSGGLVVSDEVNVFISLESAKEKPAAK